MFGSIIGMVLNWLGSDVLKQVFGYLEKKADNDTERQRIQSLKEQHALTMQADVIKTGMSHKVFWCAWGTAALPLSAWFGYGMVNTMFPMLPHIPQIPPGLLPWAQVVWGNIFISGAGAIGLTNLAKAISTRT